jgi:hypothetical protein
MGKIFQYEPYGPFTVPLENGCIPKDLERLWEEVDDAKSGLSDAVGCYILAVKKGSVSMPSYVGKTVRLGFRKEAFQVHKREHYSALGPLKNETVELYLIPRVTDTGKVRKKYDGKGTQDGKIKALEELLIGLAFAKNPELRNVKSKKQIQLPGIMNEPSGRRSHEAEMLAELLGNQRNKKRRIS